MDHHRSLKRIGVVTAGVLLAGTILLFRTGEEPPRDGSSLHAVLPAEAPPAPIPPAATVADPVRTAPAPAPLAKVDREDLIAGSENENHVPGTKPHPISPDHVRIQQELSLFKDADEALAAKDVTELRRIVGEHRASFPDQNQDMADGYELLADCLQYPGVASAARARRFFDEATYSMMRRPILRTCLEAQN